MHWDRLRFIGLWLQVHCCLLYISVDQPCRERQTISLTAINKRKKIRHCIFNYNNTWACVWYLCFYHLRSSLYLYPLPGEDRQQPVLLLVSKDLNDVLPETQREAIFIRASSEDWCSEGLCRVRPSWTEETKTLHQYCKYISTILFKKGGVFLPIVDLFFPTSHRW